MKLKLIDIAFHRNGISDAPFDLVLSINTRPDGGRKDSETDAHLRVMHAGPKLLEALERCIPIIEENCPDDNFDPAYSPEAEVLAIAIAAIAEATGKAA